MELPGLAIALVLTPGLVQFLKEQFGWQDRKVELLSFVTGAVLVFALNMEQFIPRAGQYNEFAIGILTSGLAASGYYKIGKKFFSNDDMA